MYDTNPDLNKDLPTGIAAALEAGDRPVLSQPDTPFLSEKILASRWHLSVRTLQRKRKAGGAPDHVVIGRRTLYPAAGVLAYERL